MADDEWTPALDESRLASFLTAPENTHSREVLLRHLLVYDLRRAAACAGYDLHVFVPEVDHEGFDLVLNDGDTTARVQLKSTVDAPTTRYWKVQKGHFRSSPELCERLGFVPDLAGLGQGGGVIILDARTKDTALDVHYRYTDVWVLSAMYHQVIAADDQPKQPVLQKLWRELGDGRRRDTVNLPRSLFLRARDAETLLALIGLHSRYGSNWRWRLLDVTEGPRPMGETLGRDPSCCARIVFEELRRLTSDPVSLIWKPPPWLDRGLADPPKSSES